MGKIEVNPRAIAECTFINAREESQRFLATIAPSKDGGARARAIRDQAQAKHDEMRNKQAMQVMARQLAEGKTCKLPDGTQVRANQETGVLEMLVPGPSHRNLTWKKAE